MFVSKLLDTKKGNCHSLPYLYKIITEELGVTTQLALAPNHIYIKHYAEDFGWFNTELTNGQFPLDSWIMATGYVHLDAIVNRVFMSELNNKQSIALCLIDLAEGYNRKESYNDGKFVLQCTNLALQYYPNYANALLLQAETKKKQYDFLLEQNNKKHAKELFHIPKAKQLFKSMENDYATVYELGYRPIPKPVYLKWIQSLTEEKNKHQNKKLNTFTKSNKK